MRIYIPKDVARVGKHLPIARYSVTQPFNLLPSLSFPQRIVGYKCDHSMKQISTARQQGPAPFMYIFMALLLFCSLGD